MRLTSTILIGLTVLLGACRSPNGASLGQAMNARMNGLSSSFSRLLSREGRLSSFTTTTGSLIRFETAPNQKSNQSKYVFWDRNFNRLSGIDFNKLGDTVLVGPRVPKGPGAQGYLSAGSLTDPLQRGAHFSESFKLILVREQRWPDLAGWQSTYRD